MDLISGGNIGLENGWAIIPFRDTPHYWERQNLDVSVIYKGERVEFYKSLCGVTAETYKGITALEPGNFPLCKRCFRSIQTALKK